MKGVVSPTPQKEIIATHIRSLLLVGVEDDVGVAIVELTILILGPVGDLHLNCAVC